MDDEHEPFLPDGRIVVTDRVADEIWAVCDEFAALTRLRDSYVRELPDPLAVRDPSSDARARVVRQILDHAQDSMRAGSLVDGPERDAVRETYVAAYIYCAPQPDFDPCAPRGPSLDEEHAWLRAATAEQRMREQVDEFRDVPGVTITRIEKQEDDTP